MFICKCTKQSEDDIKTMVQNGVQNWEEASEKSGAGRYCGSCLKHFRNAFRQKRLKNAPSTQKI